MKITDKQRFEWLNKFLFEDGSELDMIWIRESKFKTIQEVIDVAIKREQETDENQSISN